MLGPGTLVHILTPDTEIHLLINCCCVSLYIFCVSLIMTASYSERHWNHMVYSVPQIHHLRVCHFLGFGFCFVLFWN